VLETERVETAVIHLHVTLEQMAAAMDPAIAEIMGVLEAQGVTPVGPMFTHHSRRPTETFDFDVGFPVDRPVEPVGRVRPGALPGRRVARTVYTGPYEGLPAAWGDFSAWMDAQGLRQDEDLWEVYETGPHTSDDASTWRTELNRPLL